MSSRFRIAIPRESLGLRHVGCHQGSAGQKLFANGTDGIVRQQCPAVLADHHRIHYQRKREGGRRARDRFDHRRRSERAGFCRCRRDVLEDGVQLLEHELRRHHFDTGDAQAVLHGEQGDDRFAIASELMEGLEVRLNPRAAARVRSGDGEGDRRHSVPEYQPSV